MAHSRSISLLALRNTPLSSGIATKEWTEENFAHLSGQIWYGECSTAAATAAKAVTIPGVTALVPGMNFRIYFTYAQTYNGAPTLNVNGLGAKNIKRVGTTNAARYEWLAGETIDFVYDDNYFRMIDGGIATTTYYGVTKLATSSTSTSTSTALTPASLNTFALSVVTGAPIFSTSTNYSIGDKVRYSNAVYVCVAESAAGAWGEVSSNFEICDPLQVQIDNLSDAIADIDIPEVPTDLSAFTNSPGYLTAHQSLSDLYILSGEVVGGLSNVIIPKLDTISGLVEDEVEKVDEISAKFDNYSLTGHTHTSSDITNFPPIPTVNNGTLTIQKNGQNVQTFTANQSTSVSANIIVPTKTSDLTNDSNFLTAHQSLSALSKYLPLSGGTLTGDLTIEKSNPILTLQDNDSVRTPYVKINGLNHQIIVGNDSLTATLTLPQTSGTLALSSQIPAKTSELTNDSGFVVSSDLTKVMEYQGSVETYANLPNNASKGDVYNVVSANGDYPPGTNYAWNGTSWDPLGGSIDVSKFATKSQLINYLPLSGGSMTGPLSANNGFRAGGYGDTTGLSIGNGENNEYYTYLIANVIKTQPNGGGGVVFENGYGYGLSVDAGWASNFYGAYLNATKVKSEELFVNADIYEGGGLSVGQGTDDIYGTYINATNLTAPGMIAGINTTAPHGGLSVTGIDFGDGSYLSSANDFALVSALNKLSSETVNGLSVVVNPKLSTIAGKVEEEVAKLDELSGKLSAYTLTSDFKDLISTVTDELSSNINPKLSTIADQVSAEVQKLDELSGSLSEYALTSQIPTKVSELSNDSGYIKKTELQNDLSNYLPLSGGMISSNFALSAADRYGSGSYNFLSGVTGDLAFGLGSSATGAGAEAIGTGAVAKGHESFATGRGAQIQNEYNVDCVAVGFNAVVNTGSSYADGNDAIQLGYGTNTTPHTMQVFTHTLMDTVTGDIPYARLSANGSEFRSILPISATTASTINLSLDTYVYRVTDSGSGAFPTLISPSGVSQTGSFYYCFEIEWVTNSAAASFSQQLDWINEPEIQSDGEWHTYYITGRYDTTNSEYTMNCWRVK